MDRHTLHIRLSLIWLALLIAVVGFAVVMFT
jgi:hypothetical protein